MTDEPKTKSLEDLAKDLFHAKKAEEAAKKHRVHVEEAIAASVVIPDGKKSVTVEAGELKLTVKTGINYKADVDGLRNVDVPDDQRPLKFSPASWGFDAAAYEALLEKHPETATKLAAFVTATPAKVSVTLKV